VGTISKLKAGKPEKKRRNKKDKRKVEKLVNTVQTSSFFQLQKDRLDRQQRQDRGYIKLADPLAQSQIPKSFNQTLTTKRSKKSRCTT
jgi:hypothetical protein